MGDRVAASRGGEGGFLVGQVADHRLDLGGRMVRRGDEIEDARLVAVRKEPIDDVGADEAGASRHEHPQPDTAWRAGIETGW